MQAPWSRWVPALCCLAAFAGCGGSGDDGLDGLSVSFVKETVRIRCGGGDCAVGVVRDGGFYFVGGTRTVGGVAEQRQLALPTLTNVDIRIGDGKDIVSFVDAFVPGTVRISTGGGDDHLDICDSSAGTVMRIDTGDGNDDISVGSGGYGPRFRLDMGPGNDLVNLEALTSAGEGTVIDGGDGDDEVTGIFSEVPAGVEIVGFERGAEGTPSPSPEGPE